MKGIGTKHVHRVAWVRASPRHPAKPQSVANVSRAEALTIWRDKSITNEEAARRIGLSVRTCYRRFKDSGREAGWPKRRGK